VELTGKNYQRTDWRTLLATRRGTILVASVCALTAGAILVIAMNRYRHNVDTGARQETVLVASGVIQKGTPGSVIASHRLFKPTSIQVKQASAGAIVDTTSLRNEVAVADIYPGQQLTASDFTSNTGLAGQLAPSQRAMTISVDQAHGMVGQINDGDHVDVYGGLSVDTGGRSAPVLRLLMSNIQVLKAGSSAGGGLGASGNPSNQFSDVTLNVSDSQAGALAYAAENGKVWLVLRPPNAASTAAPSTFTAQSLLLGGKPVEIGGKR
jgi:Flp pilus assembly protein CpaB